MIWFGRYLTADLNGSGTNLEHVEKWVLRLENLSFCYSRICFCRNQFSHTDLGSYKTSGDFSFDSGATLAVSDK